jgi:DNA-directed RNA polymerase III subunit RPC8
MYVLAEMKDIVHVKPWQFNQDLRIVIENELNLKFSNKVVYDLGLCIALFDILDIDDSYIFPGDGCSHTRVTFRYIVFRPFIDEILVGKVKSCSREGIHITMMFFDDIFIPSNNLQKPSRFDEREQLFVWQYDTGESTHDLFIDIGEEIRFRVKDETFHDTTPNGPPKSTNTTTTTTIQQTTNNATATTNITNNTNAAAAASLLLVAKDEDKKSPYSIMASIDEPGLGLISWWNQ